jgi:hypothetical protein
MAPIAMFNCGLAERYVRDRNPVGVHLMHTKQTFMYMVREPVQHLAGRLKSSAIELPWISQSPSIH